MDNHTPAVNTAMIAKTDRQRLSDATAEIHGLQDRLAVVEANLRLRDQELHRQASTVLSQTKAIAKLEAQRRNQRRELRNLQKAYKAVLAAITYQIGGPGFGEKLTGRLDDDLRARGATPVVGAMPGTWAAPASMMGMTIRTDQPVPIASEEDEAHVVAPYGGPTRGSRLVPANLGATTTITGADARTGEPVDIEPPPEDGVRIVVDGVTYGVRPESGGEHGPCTWCAFNDDMGRCFQARERYDCITRPVIFVKVAK